jgi:lipooligosaccharide transport system permease protein
MASVDVLAWQDKPDDGSGGALSGSLALRREGWRRFVGTRHVYEYMWLCYKRTWRGTLTSSFFYPLLYLVALGVGLGHLVDQHLQSKIGGVPAGGLGRLGGVSYAQFIAPGVLVATAMQMGSNGSTYPVMRGLKWERTFHAMISTPVRIADVLYGHLAWVATRLATAGAVFLCVVAAFGDVKSWWALLAVPAATLTGLAFAAPMSAFAATQENDNAFTLIYRMAIMPLFLFSGTFFPLNQLPHWLQTVAAFTPLYHGVQLSRGLILGGLSPWAALGHVAYLMALVVVGTLAGRRCFERRMWQ